MDVVVDASIAISWFLVDERNADADAVLDRLATATGHVPHLFWHEMQNVLLKAERRGRCFVGEADVFMRRLRRIRLTVSHNRSDEAILDLDRVYQLTAYDAAYLDLALALNLPLATMDQHLAFAARKVGTSLLGPLAP